MSGAVLTRLPALATTGVGSLPFGSGAEAVDHLLSAYALPFCPQLPRFDGDMVSEWLGSDPGRCGWAPDRDRERPAAWDAFLDGLRRQRPAHGAVKLQVTGPLTLATALVRGQDKPGSDREVRELAQEISPWLAANIAGQVSSLSELGLETILVVDEPGLAAAGVTSEQTGIWDPLRGVAAAWGLHICGAVPWETVDAAQPDVLSFDVSRYGLPADGQEAVARLISRGGKVIWGIIDPVKPERLEDATAILAGAVDAIGRLSPLVDGAGASLVSPACGTGRMSAESERLVAAVLGASISALEAGLAATGHTRSQT